MVETDLYVYSFYGVKANKNVIGHILDEENRWIKNILLQFVTEKDEKLILIAETNDFDQQTACGATVMV